MDLLTARDFLWEVVFDFFLSGYMLSFVVLICLRGVGLVVEPIAL
jgi:hypothetical protein